VQHKYQEVPYLGISYMALIFSAIVAAAMLIHSNSRAAWMLAGAVSLGTIVGFTLTRTVGLPQSMDDIGNWLEPMGLASLFVEVIVVGVCGYALGTMKSVSSPAIS
jgi:hypothetical protein